ncbi:PREDICTED: ubiquitin carboxyl-terminal hydrolase 23-like [Ipomoea nil]|uniref:ubiquitin carboxyl-terminal hydrolase 23-like n=1 Tax=Ipomoea nil TaxID=35883 RepID=UPI0009008B94|nr:PREDICTED: ubiquitin carboxyl-terminal hydrolase 23-like [Ipomoea nil]
MANSITDPMESSLDPLASGESEQISGTSLFHRRIEFHLARKAFNGFGNGSGGFRLETLNPSSNSASVPDKAPGPGNRPSNKGSGNDGVDFDPELSLNMTFRKIMRIGAGLENLGNTCFLNAVLQCLTYTEPLAAYLESGKHQNSCRKAGFCALCAIQRHVSRALQATGRILAPKDLVSNLRCISRNFRNARQEDAHEYMVNLLESMHKCCLPSGVPSGSPGAYEKSLVHRMFGGRLRSRVKCMQCSYCSDKYDPFLDLSLEINKADSLYKALEHFTASELLDGGEKQYSCQQCKQKVRARKQLSVDKAPHVLTIHLKRFGSHVPGQKIDKKIHYGPVLDLNRFMSSPHTSDLKYTLYAVLVHAGWSTHSGHYYCFVRTSSGMWYSLDDNQVFQVNERKVLEQKAYMLFYVRDRKSALPKRHVDVAHKDSSLINGVGIKEHKCGSTKEASIAAGICSPPTATLGNVSDGTHNICRVPTAMTRPSGCDTDVRMKDVNAPMPVLSKNSTVDKDSCGSIVLPLSCNEDVINEKDSSNNSSHKPDDDSIPKKSLARCSKGKSISGKVFELGEQNLKEAGQLKSNQECGDDTQIHSFSKGNETSEIGSDILVTRSDPLRTSKTIPLKANGKTKLKVRKKQPFKSHITSMHLSSIIFGNALYVRRKRKQKLRKHCISHINNRRSLEYLNGERAPPSSFGPTSDVEVYNSGVKDQLEQGRMVNEVPKERAGNVETVLMTDKQLVKMTSSTSLGNKFDVGETIGFKDVKQSGLMKMLTRGLEETTVVSWDGKQISPLDVTEPGNECVKIGYIGDEWDEHYDQGKRKKVRSSKLDFGGQNPFQEIASKKAKMKRAKLANQPVRI